MSGSLSVSVLNSGYKPIPGGPGWDPTRQATWPARTSTLIAGDRDAILVDAFLTKSEGEELADWVKQSGKSPSLVFITHGHGDHFFGAGPTLAMFPDAQLVTLSPQVADEARGQTEPQGLGVWNSWWPDIATVCSGDVVYNNIHMWLWNSTPDSRAAWLASKDALASLKPDTIITGHKDPDAPDDDARRILDQSRRYLEDFEKAVAGGSSASEVIDAMMEKYSTLRQSVHVVRRRRLSIRRLVPVRSTGPRPTSELIMSDILEFALNGQAAWTGGRSSRLSRLT